MAICTSSRRSLATSMNSWRLVMAAIVMVGSLYCATSASPEHVPEAKESPEETVRELYADESFFRVRNAFPTAMLQRVRSCFTPELVRHFEGHNKNVARWIEEHKDETLKLPMSEGPIFVSNYEGADTFSVGRAQVEGTRAEVPVSLSYTEGADTVRWVDVAMLRRVDGVWLLDDIRFDPERLGDYTLRKRVALYE